MLAETADGACMFAGKVRVRKERSMYIESYWGSYIGGTDDSLTLLSLLEDFEKDEIGARRDFCTDGPKALEERESSFRMTRDALRFYESRGDGT